MRWKVASCMLPLLLGSAATARAETVLVRQLDDPSYDVTVPSFDFGTNQTPSRAWVDLYVHRRDLADTGQIDEYSVARAYVPGLSRIDDRIVFSSGSRTVLCATVVHRRFLFFKYDEIERTGRCDVTTTRAVRQRDDGFVVKTVPVLDVYFQVRD